MTRATTTTDTAMSDVERRRALGQVYALILSLAPKRRAAQVADQTSTPAHTIEREHDRQAHPDGC